MTNLFRGLLRQKDDLALFTFLQVPTLLLSVLLAKVLAIRHAYPSASVTLSLGLLFRSLPQDLAALALIAATAVLARRLRCPARLRVVGWVTLHAFFWFLAVLYFASAGVFIRFAGPPSRDLLLLAPTLLAHSSKVLSVDEPLVRLATLAVVWQLLIAALVWPRRGMLVSGERAWKWPPILGVALLALAALTAGLQPSAHYRERVLRRITPLALLWPAGRVLQEQPTRITPEHRRVLADLLGAPRDEGRDSLAGVARRPRNVVIWVWESVGERFLRSHHRLGRAASPQLDRLRELGSVRFSEARVECPLSAQSTFTLMTGRTPPANPRVFNSDLQIDPATPYLPAVFKAAGYHTAFLNSSYLKMWGESRFLRQSGLELLEDAESLANRSRYRSQVWSVEGVALVDRFFEWRDSLPADAPTLAVIWNVEGHFYYNWIGAPAEHLKADDLTRYEGLIEHTDELLGTFHEGLVRRGLDRDTLIVVVGDHGQGLGRGERAYDRFISLLVSEDDIHVPLVFLHPSLPRPGAVLSTPCSLADVYPTLVDLAGLELPAGIDGASLARPYQPRVTVSRAITWWPLAARAGRYKLVQDDPEAAPELYDVPADPWEVADISARRDDVTQALWAVLAATTARHAREDPSFRLFSGFPTLAEEEARARGLAPAPN